MENNGNDGRAVGSMRLWEASVSIGFFLFGALVMWDSHRLGSAWASDGPQAGYFPFYIGLIICISSVINLLAAINMGERGRKAFVKRGQLKMVLTVLIPSAVFVAMISNPVLSLGIYASSALFIAYFMWYLGKYSLPRILAVSLATVIVFFMMFEVWFLVPLPKGPIEAAFGFL